VSSVAIDSRKVEQDALFIPLPGARVDGHDFIGAAAKLGAKLVLVAEQKWPALEAACLALAAAQGTRFILVANTLTALQDLAYYHINRFPDLVRIGVTGSSGKTTTKEIIGRILSQAGETAVNEGNLNSDIGLPLAIFKVKPVHRYAVFEMGMSYPGEMDGLARLIRPHYALVTNIGQAHLEQLGSQEGIAREKKKIFKYFSGKEKGFIYEDEPFYSLLRAFLMG
jgi:UDP-N-acetylmuramoyl-tripeptide--D-alanyl-D-alanine ligase